MTKRRTKADKRNTAQRAAFAKKTTKELLAHFRKLKADNLERISNISDDEWAAALALDEEEL